MDWDLEKIRKSLFKSLDSSDWKSKEGWIRRAVYWKLCCMATYHETQDATIKKIILNAFSGDTQRSPSTDEIINIAPLCIKKYNERHKKKIVIAKG